MPDVHIPINKIMPQLNEKEFLLVRAITKGEGFILKSAAPKIKSSTQYVDGLKRKILDQETARQAYLWKAVAYHISPYIKDMVSPPYYKDYLTNKDDADRMDIVAKIIVDSVPKEHRWGDITRGG